MGGPAFSSPLLTPDYAGPAGVYGGTGDAGPSGDPYARWRAMTGGYPGAMTPVDMSSPDQGYLGDLGGGDYYDQQPYFDANE